MGEGWDIMSNDNLEDRVKKLEHDQKETDSKIGWLTRTMNHVLDILRTVGGHYRRAGKIDKGEGAEGEDKSE
jgi:hypothetical protein